MPAASPSSSYWDQFLQPVTESLRSDGKPCLTGLHGAATAFALTLSARTLPTTSWLIVTASDEEAERLYDDLQFFHAMLGLPPDPLALFPEWETLPYEATPPLVELIARRMRTLHQLTDQAPTILVTSLPALVQRLLPRSIFSGVRWPLRPGDNVERDVLTARLLRLGYRRGSVVENPGEFSIRGGIVDIYSTAYADPLRVEFLGDTVESVRVFDTATQKSTTRLTDAWLLPARELIYPEGRSEGLAPLPPDAEWRGPDLYPSMATLLDYFHDRPVIVLDQPQALAEKAREFRDEVLEAYERHGRADEAQPYPSPDRLYHQWEEILGRIRPWPTLAMEPLAPPDGSWQPVAAFPVQSPTSIGLARRGTPFTETLATLDRLRSAGPVLIVARSRGQVDRLLALFAEHDLPATPWKPPHWTPAAQGGHKQPFYLLQGDLSAGFVSAEGRLSIITEEELFAKGLRHRPPPKSKTAAFLSSLEDLNVGDYVVHVQHGIGRYEGLRRLSVQDFESDYLILSFAAGDKLYVPLDRLNQVQRYRGADSHAPRMDRLGGTSWARTTARVKKDIEEMAGELVELYANREIVHRNEYGGDSTLTHEFEAAFEYEETTDQLRAIEDIKRDMESPKPMDRLVCGDVGYGKTEVAMRAAFKAVEHNRQVAVLVPTTLLAQQHYDNFSQRF
ncbi:MAG: DEAD/DEAH box helicase, partial [Nitrospirae bacterium]